MTRLPRRSLLAAALALTAIQSPSGRARAGEKTLRVGFQKAEPVLLAARQNRDLETLLAPLGWTVEWTEFQFGPPMLEAMRAGAIDLGAVGDTPPIFAQAAHADLLYVSGLRSGSQAILLPPNSPIQSLADLKGKKLAFGRGSSAHNFALKALEKADLRYDQIDPVILGPADGAAAFSRGAIDAWSIWDPYYALFETRPGVRVLATNAELGEQPSFFMAWAPFVRANPDLTARIIAGFASTAGWVRDHRDTIVTLLSASTAMPPDAMRRAIDRVPAEVFALTEPVLATQQRVADRFRAQGLLPVSVTVADTVWHNPSA